LGTVSWGSCDTSGTWRASSTSNLPDGRKKRNAPGVLSFVRTDDGQQTVAFQKLAYGFISVEVRTAPHVVMHEILWALLLPKVLDRV
jgi:hypothetical protein